MVVVSDTRPVVESAPARSVSGRSHVFDAIVFVENFNLRAVAQAFPGAAASPHELRVPLGGDSEFTVYPFGAIVFHDVSVGERERVLAALRVVQPVTTAQVVREDFTVEENATAPAGVVDGRLRVDVLSPLRAGIVAFTVAQSAAMEYYEVVVEELFDHTRGLIRRLEKRGTVTSRMRPLHRFIGEALRTRTDVLSVLHLLDRPDATWDDPVMDRIYGDLREEFDLADRYDALESKLRGVQDALELVLDVARDRRMVLLEASIVLLIVLELVVSLRQAF